jgi:uncharacterized protein (TIGR02646 family)
LKYSTKQAPPACLTDWLAQENEDWQPSFGTLQNPEKSGTHSALLNEQRDVCAYCGRSLKADRTDSHIDHFQPQARFPDLALDYGNFFASCGPSHLPHPSAKTLPRTCGDAKGDWFDDQFHIKPSEPGCEQRFTYGTTGEIFATPGDQAALNMILHLRLDDSTLKYERGQIIQEVEQAIAQGHTSAADEILLRRTPGPQGRLPSLGHVAARYLENEPL